MSEATFIVVSSQIRPERRFAKTPLFFATAPGQTQFERNKACAASSGNLPSGFGCSSSKRVSGFLSGVRCLVVLLCLVLTCVSRAQSYTVDFFTADSGGGKGASGIYGLEGTIGQPDAGYGVGGKYTVEGGFWSVAINHFWEPTTIELSPQQGSPGSAVIVSGKVGSGANGARIYWHDGSSSIGLTETPADSAGNFQTTITVPAGAVPSLVSVEAQAIGSDGTDMVAASYTVLAPEPGVFSGTVLGANSLPLANFNVDLFDAAGLPSGNAKTDSEGKFAFPGLLPGTYTASAGDGASSESATVTPGGNADGFTLHEIPSGSNLFPPVYFFGAGAIALPGGALNSSTPVKIGAWTNKPFAHVPSLKGKNQKPLSVRFWANIKKGTLDADAPLIVSFQIFKGGAELVQKVVANPTLVHPSSPFNFTAFHADFNLHELPPGSLTLRIVPVTTLGAKLGNNDFKIEMEDLGSRWFSKSSKNRSLTVTKDKNNLKYSYSAFVPKKGIDFNEPIDLEIVAFDNIVQLGVPVKETWTTGAVDPHTWGGKANANAQITLLSYDFYNGTLPFNGPFGGNLSSSVYQMPLTRLPLTSKECRGIPGLSLDFKHCIDPCPVFSCDICGGVEIGAFYCLQAFADLSGDIRKDLAPRIVIAPGGTLSVGVKAWVYAVVCSGGGEAFINTDLKLPIVLDYDESIGFDSPCISFQPEVKYSVRCLGYHLWGGTKKFAKRSWPANCDTQAQSNSLSVVAALEVEEEFDPGLKMPSVAASGTGKAMSVWIEEQKEGNDPVSRPRLLWSQFDGTGWTASERLVMGDHVADAPRVAYLNETHAIATWIQSRLPAVQFEEAGDDGFLSSLEIYYAIWDGSNWSTPALVTNDETFDTFPMLTSDPSTGRALLVWSRMDTSPVTVELRNLKLAYALFDGSEWDEPAFVEPETSTLGMLPSPRFAGDGSAHVVWVRDADGDFSTRGDRSLALSTLGQSGWTAPELIPGLPLDPYSPSLAFDSNNRPAVSFVVPAMDPETDLPSGGDGNNSKLWLARRSNNGWQGYSVSEFVGSEVFAERPVLNITEEDKAVIAFRWFGLEGDTRAIGCLGAVVADLIPTTPTWSIGELNNDGLINWETAFAYDPSSKESFVINAAQTPGLDHDDPFRGVRQFCVPFQQKIGFASEALIFSNQHPALGEQISITANIVNRGFASIADGQGLTVNFYDGNPEVEGTFIGQQTFSGSLAFGESIPLAVNYTPRALGLRNITAVVMDEDQAPLLSTFSILGKLPAVQNLSPLVRTGSEEVTLQWGSEEGVSSAIAHRIFRSVSGREGSFEYIGSTSGQTFTDYLTLPQVTYYYAVQAMDEAGVVSPLSEPVSLRWTPFVAPEFVSPNKLGIQLYRESIILSWPASEKDLLLEQSPELIEWIQVEQEPTTIGDEKHVSLPFDPEEGTIFFRLVKP